VDFRIGDSLASSAQVYASAILLPLTVRSWKLLSSAGL